MSCGVSSGLFQNVVFAIDVVPLQCEACHVVRVDPPSGLPVVDHDASKMAEYFAVEITIALEANVEGPFFLELVGAFGDVLLPPFCVLHVRRIQKLADKPACYARKTTQI